MYRICTTENAVAQQREYEACLLELMLITPYEKITVGDICDKMGTTRKSFYYYFKNKQGCLSALIDYAHYDAQNYELPDDVELNGYPRSLLSHLTYQMETRS